MMIFPKADHGIWSPSVESLRWSFFVEALAPEAPAWGRRGETAYQDGAASEGASTTKEGS
jgi:hypothetical protein